MSVFKLNTTADRDDIAPHEEAEDAPQITTASSLGKDQLLFLKLMTNIMKPRV